MDRWNNKIAVVTGASSGIGTAIAIDLVKANLIVIALARRIHKMEDIRKELPENIQNRFVPLKCDVTNEIDVKNSFQWIEKKFGGIDILVNNAGILKEGNLVTMNTNLIREVLNTNVMGIIYCTQYAFKSMQNRKFDGHIININSIAGHKLLNMNDESRRSFNIYPPSKFAVTAISETYRQECHMLGTKIKTTNISPGLVATEILPKDFAAIRVILEPKDISNAVLFAISTPPNVQISELTIQPVGEQL